jgi:hypothetical protein
VEKGPILYAGDVENMPSMSKRENVHPVDLVNPRKSEIITGLEIKIKKKD